MSNNKQTEIDIAELAMKLYPFSNSQRNAFITGYNKAKEMYKEEIIQAWKKGDGQFDKVSDKMSLEYYNKTYGGGEQ